MDALDLAEAYARRLEAGSDEELVLRLDAPVARIDLVPEAGGASWYSVPFGVSIEGPVALDGVPIRVVGRWVRLAGLELGGLTAERVQIVAREGVVLERCTLTGLPDPRPGGSVAIRVARDDAAPEVRLTGCVLRPLREPLVGVATPGPALVDVSLEGCDLGDGLVLVAEGASRVAVRGGRRGTGAQIRCAPGDVVFAG
jgi:hypothetical protein